MKNKTVFSENIFNIYEYILSDLKTMGKAQDIKKILIDTIIFLHKNVDLSEADIVKKIIDDYLEKVKIVGKLSPGFSAGIKDVKNNITINVCTGFSSDKKNAKKITLNTSFDIASITKMFTSILLLKKEEHGDIDLDKPFSFYSLVLKKIDVPVLKVLKFGTELRTNGRLDDNDLSKIDRIERLKNVYIYNKNTFLYSDIPYMIVLFLFGNTLEEANLNYLRDFYSFYSNLGLKNTTYFKLEKTGGILNEQVTEEQIEIFDSKARLFEMEDGFVFGHAGLTSTIKDIQLLFILLYNGLLSENSLRRLITPVIYNQELLLDDFGKPIIRNGKIVYINRGMGVYINLGNISKCDISEFYSKNAFASAGSTGTYSVFDLDNGLNATYFSNIKSMSCSKVINTGNYNFGDEHDMIPKFFDTIVIGGTNTKRDGSIIRPDGSEMNFSRAMNNFKNEQFIILLKLRFLKLVLSEKIIEQTADNETRKNKLLELDKLFNINIEL